MKNINNENTHDKTTESTPCKRGGLRRFMFRRAGWWKRKRMNRLVEKLGLEATQREGLEAIFAEIESLKSTAFSSRRDVGAGLVTAIQGEAFDKDVATDALQQPISTIQAKMELTLQRFGEWFNALNESQQQQLRVVLQRRLAH